MKTFLNILTSLALRFRYVTLALVGLLLVLGAIAATELNQELLPPIEFPQTIVLAQASGMTSEEVLVILTERLEASISEIPEVINLESQTSGAIGGLLTVYNDFGENQDELQAKIREAIDNTWLPVRRITPPEGTDAQTFATGLIADITPEMLLYLAESNSNFLFQLSPEIWDSMSDETVTAALAYLAQEEDVASAGATALARLVQKELAPQLTALDLVANITTAGGQELPTDGEEIVEEDSQDIEAQSLLLRLSLDTWEAVSPRVGGLGELNDDAVATLSDIEITIPEVAPALPESWQIGAFKTVEDILEIQTITNSASVILNDFYETGRITGALGQTDDLDVETMTNMLEIAPSLVNYFEAEQLVAMSPEVFALLPEDYIAGLDGFTRDALAAADLARAITGEDAEREPVDLPGPWRIQLPSLISFSFSDIPLATFSVASVGEIELDTATADTDDSMDDSSSDEATDEVSVIEYPEGPELPALFGLSGELFGAELDTADDLINITLSGDFAELLGEDSISGAEFFNLLLQFGDFAAAPPADGGDDATAGAPVGFGDLDIAAFVPALTECGVGLLDVTSGNFDFAGALVGCLTPDQVQFLLDNDPTFVDGLDAGVFALFTDEVLLIDGISPPLPDAWGLLQDQPQFATSLRNAGDVVEQGDGSPALFLDQVNQNIPERFAGYEVRLFDSLTPDLVRYFLLVEPEFYANLDADVLLKFNQDVLANVAIDGLDDDVATQITAIASGEQPTAVTALQELYISEIAPADPDAPALNDAWSFLEPAYGIELNSADDFFRFPEGYIYADAGELINSIYASPQGAGFAPVLLGGMPIEAVQYVLDRDETAFNSLTSQSLQDFSDDALALMPQVLQDRALEGADNFTPTAQITRTNGNSSLFLTIFKTSDANTVTAFHKVNDLIQELDANNDSIVTGIVFEQSSFIEDSISGVAREGSLGAVFAIIIILIFLSGGTWTNNRRTTGVVMVVLFGGLLAGLVALGLEAAGNDWGAAFAQADTVLRVLLIGGLVSGLVILLFPSNLPDPAWRATIVIGVSIPLSILTSLVLMRWFAPAMHEVLAPLAADSDLFTFILRLFPEELTLNIMTLSGLTVAVGRVVDDSIVVLENVFRQLQAGGDKKQVIIKATRDVASAIFTATLVALIVFLPLGLTGGIIGAFFLPFGLAVTYALVGSFTVAITVVPVMSYLLIDPDKIPEDKDIWLAAYYLPVLKWAISSKNSRRIVIGIAILSMPLSGILLGTRPAAFLPSFGEVQISLSLEMPAGTQIEDTNDVALELEQLVRDTIPEDQLTTIQTTVGGGGTLSLEALFTGGGVSENLAGLTIGLRANEEELETFTEELTTGGSEIVGDRGTVVAASASQDGGFGGFELVVSGDPDDLAALDATIIETINSVEGISEASSNLSAIATGDEGPTTFIRVNQTTALSYSAELDTDNTIGVTAQALEALLALPDLPEGITISQGFDSEIQTQGFNSLPIAMGIAIVIVIIILIFSFQSPVYWLVIILSIVVAPIGAAIALTISDRVLGISALIGLLMLLGLVVTNAVVLIDRVIQNRKENGMEIDEAIIEAGGRRLRPILMTSLATIIALIPLTVGLSEGAIIASELGTVVIGGVMSSTLLTLIVVPVAYRMLYRSHDRFANLFSRGNN